MLASIGFSKQHLPLYLSMFPIAVTLADDNLERCNALATHLRHDAEVQLLSVNADAFSLQTHVLVIGLLPSARLSSWLHIARLQKIKVLLLADDMEQQELALIQGLSCGAKGIFEPLDALDNIGLAVKKIHAGDNWVSRKMQGKILEHKLEWCHGNAIKKLSA